jgi:hypothetical protein
MPTGFRADRTSSKAALWSTTPRRKLARLNHLEARQSMRSSLVAHVLMT